MMIRKMTLRAWTFTMLMILVCLAFGVPMLWINGPAALELLRGGYPQLARTEPVENIYLFSVLGVVFVFFALMGFVHQLRRSVRKLVKRYLAEHQEITLEQLESDFAAAQKVGGIWVGRFWTFSDLLDNVVVENSRIAWVHDETVATRRGESYSLYLGLADGKTERIGMSSAKGAALKEIYGKFPHILVSNSPEYAYLFSHDLKAFLNIKYRQN